MGAAERSDLLEEGPGGSRAASPTATVWAGVAVIASLAMHAPVLGTWFYNDDLLHLYQLTNFGAVDFLLDPFGGHLYAVRNTIFAAAHGVFGLWAAGYMGLLLANHLLNVVLLFAVLRGFLGATALAGLGALLWGASVVHRGVLDWYSAHGIALVATLMLWLLLDVARIRSGALILTHRRTFGWAALLLAAALCYGVGVALAIGFPLVAKLLLPEGALDRPSFWVLVLVAIATPLLYAALWTLPTLEGGARGAGVQLTILYPPAWLYMLRTALALIGYGLAVLLLGPFVALGTDGPIAAGMLARTVGAGPLAAADVQSVALGFAVLGGALLIGLALVAWRLAAGERRLLLGFGALGIVCYGMIAVGRAHWGLMLKFDPEVVATTARYQYLGTIPICLLVCEALRRLRPGSRTGRRAAAIALGTAYSVLFAAGVPVADRIGRPDPRPRRELARLHQTVVRAAEAQGSGETVWIRNRPFPSVETVARRRERFPGWAAAWVLSEANDEIDGRPVRFVEKDAAMVARLRDGRHDRVTRLVVTRTECGNCVAH